MNMPHVRDKAKVAAAMNGHVLGRFIWNPPAAMAYRRAPADQQGLAMCRDCEATASTRGTTIWGSALTHPCPYRYSDAELAAIDAADPVTCPCSNLVSGIGSGVGPDAQMPDRTEGDRL